MSAFKEVCAVRRGVRVLFAGLLLMSLGSAMFAAGPPRRAARRSYRLPRLVRSRRPRPRPSAPRPTSSATRW